jgi:GTP pyrophosphokinase
VVDKVLAAIKERLASAGIEAAVTGREKHIYSIYSKMMEKHLSFSQVLDIYGFRVVVNDVPACYLALGALHSLYKPVPGKFKDYIAIPKVNGYQSLHTTLIGPYGMPVEIQIRTQAMSRIADSGVASHWLYKSDADINEVQQRTHKWLQSLLDIQRASGDSTEFLEHIKVDLFPDEVYVFTPKGKIMSMPRGATTVDFAYAVHTDIGNRCVAAKINYELVPLRTEIKNGDRVEIITAAHAHPNPAWLSYVKTAKARSHIRHFLKTMQYEESAALGERMLNQAIRALGAKPSEAAPERWERLVRDSGAKSRREVLADIGLGKRLAAIVARKLLLLAESGQAEPKAPAGTIVIHGSEGMAVQFAKCCNPIPGDPITGFIKKGQGLVVHTHDCPTASKLRGDPEKWLDVEWAPETNKMFDVGIRVMVANHRGVLAKVASAMAEAGSNIDNVSMDEERDPYTTMHFTLQVANRQHLARVLRALRRIQEVVRIARVKD